MTNNINNNNGGTEPRPQALQVAQPNLSQFLQLSARTARTLANLIRKQGLAINITGKDYVLAEGFALLARFEGLNIFTEAKTCKDGQVEVTEAKAIIRDKNGIEVASATAKVSTDEPNWRGKPLYARESMAQTRAMAKALRLRYGFLIKLAGYEPTPAEEIIDLKTPQQAQNQLQQQSQDQQAQQEQKEQKQVNIKNINLFWKLNRSRLKSMGVETINEKLDAVKVKILQKAGLDKTSLKELTPEEWQKVFLTMQTISDDEFISFVS